MLFAVSLSPSFLHSMLFAVSLSLLSPLYAPLSVLFAVSPARRTVHLDVKLGVVEGFDANLDRGHGVARACGKLRSNEPKTLHPTPPSNLGPRRAQERDTATMARPVPVRLPETDSFHLLTARWTRFVMSHAECSGKI